MRISFFFVHREFVKDLSSRDNIKVELNNRLILRRKEIHEGQKQSMYVGQASTVTLFFLDRQAMFAETPESDPSLRSEGGA